MKTIPKSMFCLVALFLGGCVLGPDAPRIPNGGKGWPVVFEDTKLTRSEKKAILDDYLAICAQSEPQGSYGVKTLEGKTILLMRHGVDCWHIADGLFANVQKRRENPGGLLCHRF